MQPSGGSMGQVKMRKASDAEVLLALRTITVQTAKLRTMKSIDLSKLTIATLSGSSSGAFAPTGIVVAATDDAFLDLAAIGSISNNVSQQIATHHSQIQNLRNVLANISVNDSLNHVTVSLTDVLNHVNINIGQLIAVNVGSGGSVTTYFK
jgi:hypothetical protein